MRVKDGEVRSAAPAIGEARITTGRFGRLAPPAGAGRSVRCSCDRCGAHLMGVVTPGGRPRGICLVCGGESVSLV